MALYMKNDILLENDAKIILQYKYEVKYSEEDQLIIRNKHKKLINDNIIRPCKYYDDFWEIIYDEYNYRVNFNVNVTSKIKNSLRYYVVLLLKDAKMCPKTVANNISRINRILIKSNTFQIKQLDRLINNIECLSKSERYVYARIVLDFCYFAEIEMPKQYYDYFCTIPYYPGGGRELPDYRSTILFEYLINAYYKEINNETFTLNQKYYFPIFLWWKLTKIIPMRVIEFCKLKIDCCYYCQKANKYILHVKRAKKRSERSIPPLEKIIVTKKVYDYLQMYINMTKQYRSRKYLFSPKSHSLFRSIPARISQNEHFNFGIMGYLLKKFTYQIIMKKYGLNIILERSFTEYSSGKNIQILKPGDTRHFAFCSLKLQGVNPLTIARLGGHSNIRTQDCYYGHIEKVVESQVSIMAERIKSHRKNKGNPLYLDISKTQEMIINSRSRKIKNESRIREVEGGKCYDYTNEIYPIDCPEYCIYCPYFELEGSIKPKKLEKFRNMEDSISIEIKTILQTLEYISKTMKIDIKRQGVDPAAQAQLYSETKNLYEKIKHQAILYSYTRN